MTRAQDEAKKARKGWPIVVSEHAHIRSLQRKGLKVDVEAVREALKAGRIKNHKPARFRLYGQPKGRLEPTDRFLWNEDESVAWIARIDGEKWIVTTTLTPATAVTTKEED